MIFCGNINFLEKSETTAPTLYFRGNFFVPFI